MLRLVHRSTPRVQYQAIASLSSLKGLVTGPGGVHATKKPGLAKNWRNKPLLRRDGDKVFKTGMEATELLEMEAQRKDPQSEVFLDGYNNMAQSLNVVFDRMPKYAWIMKHLLEPERTIIFRVAWIDDQGISRVNRGYRIQYSSALGPYEGGTSFHPDQTMDMIKANAFHTTFSNALLPQSTGSFGGAFGGADFNPYDKSENEIQRFCQSYMTELSKYIGPDFDLPGMGDGVSEVEIGYMYGQYKRINQHFGRLGRGLLWGGSPAHRNAKGMGIVHFANAFLTDKKMSLEGKRVSLPPSYTYHE